MAEADWSSLSDDPGISVIDRGVTAGITPPPGGGSFIFGFNSLTNAALCSALYTLQSNFAPTPANKGGSVRGAIKRGVSSGPINFSPFFMAGLQGTASTDLAYLLGLSDADPCHISLRKGSVFGGVPDGAPDTSQAGVGILARSVATFARDTWLHLRLDWIVNLNGDVILQVFRSDLSQHDVDAPVWVAEPGLEQFIDDSLQVNSGSAAFTSGRMGFGFKTSDISRRAFFDRIEILREV